MWDKLLKWGKNPWVWGITIPVGLFVFSRWGGGSATSNSEGDAQPGGLESGVLPMFITGGLGGGGANMMGGSAPLPLGGEIWQQPAVPLSENPDVRIAEIYAGVQMAAIDAQREATLRGALSADSITQRPAMQPAYNNITPTNTSRGAYYNTAGKNIDPRMSGALKNLSSDNYIKTVAQINNAQVVSSSADDYAAMLARRRAQGY